MEESHISYQNPMSDHADNLPELPACKSVGDMNLVLDLVGDEAEVGDERTNLRLILCRKVSHEGHPIGTMTVFCGNQADLIDEERYYQLFRDINSMKDFFGIQRTVIRGVFES